MYCGPSNPQANPTQRHVSEGETVQKGKAEALDPNSAKQKRMTTRRGLCGYLIRLLPTTVARAPACTTMIATDALESAIRTAIPVAHLEIFDQSNGCGENYAILVVSEVRLCARQRGLQRKKRD